VNNEIEHLQNTRFHGWWRWPLLPFAAYLGASVGSELLTVLSWLYVALRGGPTQDGLVFLHIVEIVQSAVYGYLFGYIACAVAPRAKRTAGGVMAGVLAIATLFALFLVWTDSYRPLVPTSLTTIQLLGSVAAAIYVVVRVPSPRAVP
jgi:hypothetical protein